jgi:uncharacterized protein (DUF1015 family)
VADIYPFKGYGYSPEFLSESESLFVPPYDVISESDLKQFRKNNPFNYIHLTLAGPKGDTDSYRHVRKKMENWIKKSILVQDEEPSLYFYTMEFQVDPDIALSTETKKRKKVLSGFISLVRLDSFESGIIIPHEVTFPAPKEDRMKLLSSCQTHLEPIYALFEDKKCRVIDKLTESVGRRKPVIKIKDANGTLHRFWKVSDQKVIKDIQKFMKAQSLLIADGHHRCEAALAYRSWLAKNDPEFNEEHPANFIMMFLANMDDEGLFIAPTHRLVRELNGLDSDQILFRMGEEFNIAASPVTNHAKARKWLLEAIAGHQGKAKAFGYYDGWYYLLTQKKNKSTGKVLETEILQEKIMKEVLAFRESQTLYKNTGYTHSYKESLDKVDSGEFKCAFILKGPDIHDVKVICKAGRRLPQKSTYFYPKPLSGFVLYKF